MTGVSCVAFKIRRFTVNAIRVSADQNRDLELRSSHPDVTPGSEKVSIDPLNNSAASTAVRRVRASIRPFDPLRRRIQMQCQGMDWSGHLVGQ